MHARTENKETDRRIEYRWAEKNKLHRMGTGGSFPGWETGWGAKLTTHFQLVPRC